MDANQYDWVYKAISQLSPEITVNPKLLRSLLNRTYKMVTSDLPRRERLAAAAHHRLCFYRIQYELSAWNKKRLRSSPGQE